jgi:hypothetical protein
MSSKWVTPLAWLRLGEWFCWVWFDCLEPHACGVGIHAGNNVFVAVWLCGDDCSWILMFVSTALFVVALRRDGNAATVSNGPAFTQL